MNEAELLDDPESSGRLRSVMTFMVHANAHGTTLSELSRRFALDGRTALDLVTALENAGFVELAPGLRRWGCVVWVATDLAIDTTHNPRFQQRLRKCLGCGTMFISEHAGNRICVKCDPDDPNKRLYHLKAEKS